MIPAVHHRSQLQKQSLTITLSATKPILDAICQIALDSMVSYLVDQSPMQDLIKSLTEVHKHTALTDRVNYLFTKFNQISQKVSSLSKANADCSSLIPVFVQTNPVPQIFYQQCRYH